MNKYKIGKVLLGVAGFLPLAGFCVYCIYHSSDPFADFLDGVFNVRVAGVIIAYAPFFVMLILAAAGAFLIKPLIIKEKVKIPMAGILFFLLLVIYGGDFFSEIQYTHFLHGPELLLNPLAVILYGVVTIIYTLGSKKTIARIISAAGLALYIIVTWAIIEMGLLYEVFDNGHFGAALFFNLGHLIALPCLSAAWFVAAAKEQPKE